MARSALPPTRASRFSSTPLGFLRFRIRSNRRLEKSSWKKWRPIVRQVEELREELFDARPWSEIDPEDIAYELIPRLYRRCRGRKGEEPATNTLRGRFDACKAYFEFLEIIGELARNPCDWQARPSSKAREKPFLEPSEDEKLARAPKEGHEIAIYALTRGAGLR